MNENERQLFAEAVVVAQNQLAVNNTAGSPEKFPSALFPDWFSWKAHFSYLMDKHGWTDEQARSTIPTLLVGWAMQEFNAMPTLSSSGAKPTRSHSGKNDDVLEPEDVTLQESEDSENRVQELGPG